MFTFEAGADDLGDAGRRARKKQATRQRLLAEARRLMAGRGYEGTTMEAVAAAADVAVGSVYNYFATKQALLLAVIGDACGSMVQAGEAVVSAPPTDAHEAVFALMHAYVDTLRAVDRALLRRAFAISFSEPPEASAELVQLDMVMIEQLRRLVEHFAARGVLTDEIEPEPAALALYGAFTLTTMFWMSLPEGGETPDCDAMLDGQLEVVFRGLLPRPTRRTR